MFDPHQSYLLSRERAEQAVDMIRPAIYWAMKEGVLKREHLHIVVMNPATRSGTVENDEDAILYEESFNEGEWENNYRGIARAKAIASWRTGIPTQILRETMPYMLVANEDHADTPYFGSAVLHGVVVSASGVQPWFDEWISYMVAAACRALCIGVMQEEIIPNKGRDFIWQQDLDSDNLGDR